jgi:2-methylisocitrate lyase-like PEP mutase family enzyme
VNARTDVYLRRLTPPEGALAETLARAKRYAAAGADGLFVPGLSETSAIRAVTSAVGLPLNLLVLPKLPPVAELRECGVRRLSAGSGVFAAAFGAARRAALQLLGEGRYEAMYSGPIAYGEMNALFARPGR